MNRLLVSAVATTCVALAPAYAFAAGSVSAGERKSEDCADCHGPDGRGDDDTIKSIAGIPVEKFVQAMADFKSGKRTSSNKMRKLGSTLSAADIADLAAYYASLPP